MKSKTIIVLTVFVIVAIGVGVYFATGKSEEKPETVAETRPERPRTRSRQEIRSRMKDRLEEAKTKALSMRSEMSGRRMGGPTKGYVRGSAKKSLDSVTALDAILDKAERDETLSASSKQAVEEILNERDDLTGTKIERTDCIKSFCRVVLAFEDQKSLMSYQSGTQEDAIFGDKYRFSLTQSKNKVTSGSGITGGYIPMETRFYYSNTSDPLPMDEKLQSEPEV